MSQNSEVRPIMGWKFALRLLGAVVAVLVVVSPIWVPGCALWHLRGRVPREGETWPYELARILGPRFSSRIAEEIERRRGDMAPFEIVRLYGMLGNAGGKDALQFFHKEITQGVSVGWSCGDPFAHLAQHGNEQSVLVCLNSIERDFKQRQAQYLRLGKALSVLSVHGDLGACRRTSFPAA